VHAYRQSRGILCLCFFTFLFSGNLGAAESLQELFLLIDGKIVEDGDRVEINWSMATGTKIGRVSIQRRILGETYNRVMAKHCIGQKFCQGLCG
jgi:hypothetical protein